MHEIQRLPISDSNIRSLMAEIQMNEGWMHYSIMVPGRLVSDLGKIEYARSYLY